jgi:hypothetical protein
MHTVPVTLLFGLVLGSMHHLEETTPFRGAVVELLRVALAKQAPKLYSSIPVAAVLRIRDVYP